jgi:hypothetical protein
MTERREVLMLNKPTQGVMKHGSPGQHYHYIYSDYPFKLQGDYLCVVSHFFYETI